MISIEPLYRSKHLGALLMLLITFEVQINKGQHLYLIEPRIGVLGFYLQLGFHPAPDDAHKHHSICHSDNLPDTHSGFAEKLNATRNQPLWRGELNLVQSLLLKKVTPSFQFHQSF
ncbi:GNAT family N-acetyltransferase [Endozoicomonas lisbonensis]